MKTHNSLGDAVLMLFDYIQSSRSAEERKLLDRASGAVTFLSRTGQLHPFEEFHKSTTFGQIQSVSFVDVIRLLERLWARAPSADDKDILHVAISALTFIESTGQHAALDEYLSYMRLGTLPPVTAAFKSREEAEDWLDAQPVPPTMARILIDDEYHTVIADRESRSIPFARIPVIAEFIEKHLRHGLPPAVASFDTREQAESWLSSATDLPRHAFITIQGEYHLAACWKNVNHRALYPLTRVDELEEERHEESDGEEPA